MRGVRKASVLFCSFLTQARMKRYETTVFVERGMGDAKRGIARWREHSVHTRTNGHIEQRAAESGGGKHGRGQGAGSANAGGSSEAVRDRRRPQHVQPHALTLPRSTIDKTGCGRFLPFAGREGGHTDRAALVLGQRRRQQRERQQRQQPG